MKMKPMIYQKERKVELLYKDKYRKYTYYILNLGTHPTAYVEIPKIHSKRQYDINVYVHGGITYVGNKLMDIDGYFIGWAYAHGGDYLGFFERIEGKQWTTEEIVEDCKSVIDQIIELERK